MITSASVDANAVLNEALGVAADVLDLAGANVVQEGVVHDRRTLVDTETFRREILEVAVMERADEPFPNKA